MPNATCKKIILKIYILYVINKLIRKKLKYFFSFKIVEKINNNKIIRDRGLLIDQSNDGNFLTNKKKSKMKKKAAAAVRPYDFFLCKKLCG